MAKTSNGPGKIKLELFVKKLEYEANCKLQ